MFIYLDLLHYGYLEGVREFIVHFFFLSFFNLLSHPILFPPLSQPPHTTSP